MSNGDDDFQFELFDTYFAGVPAATLPIGAAPILVFQGGTTKQTPASSASSLTIASTPITGGTNACILFDKAGVVGEDTNFEWDYTDKILKIQGKNAAFVDLNASGDNWFFAESGNTTVSGLGNIGIGHASLGALTSGGANLAIGGDITLTALQTGNGNICVGYGSGFTVVSGGENIMVGVEAGFNLTGNQNTLVGGRNLAATNVCGQSITSGSQCIVIGAACDVPSASANGQLSIGNYIYGTGLTAIGNSVSSGKIGIGLTSPSYNLHVKGDGPAFGVQGVSAAAQVVLTGNSENGSSSGTGFVDALGVNTVNNKQRWFGDLDYLGLNTGNFIRFATVSGTSQIDCILGDGSGVNNLLLGNTGANGGVQIMNDCVLSQRLYFTNNFDTTLSRASAGVLAIGQGGAVGDASGTIQAKTKAGAVVAADLTSGTWAVIRDTVNNTTKVYYNNAGTLMAVALV